MEVQRMSFLKKIVQNVLPCEGPGFHSPWRSYQKISLAPRAARPTQSSILPRSVNEYFKALIKPLEAPQTNVKIKT